MKMAHVAFVVVVCLALGSAADVALAQGNSNAGSGNSAGGGTVNNVTPGVQAPPPGSSQPIEDPMMASATHEMHPTEFSAQIRFDSFNPTNNSSGFLGVGGEFGFCIADGGGFNTGVLFEIGSTDLAGADTFIVHVLGDFGLEIPLLLGDFSITLDLNGRIGVSLLNFSNTFGNNQLWYLPLELAVGPHFYLSPGMYIPLEIGLGVRPGITAANGGTPTTLISFGLTTGIGFRF